MPADGANGLLITRREIAVERGLDRYIVPIGYGEMTNSAGAHSLVDITRTGHRSRASGHSRKPIAALGNKVISSV